MMRSNTQIGKREDKSKQLLVFNKKSSFFKFCNKRKCKLNGHWKVKRIKRRYQQIRYSNKIKLKQNKEEITKINKLSQRAQ